MKQPSYKRLASKASVLATMATTTFMASASTPSLAPAAASSTIFNASFFTGLASGLVVCFPLLLSILARQHHRRLKSHQEHAPFARSIERSLDLLQQTAVGTWEWDIQTGKTVFNERWAAIIGYRLDELGPTSIDTWTMLAHPDDLKKSEQLLQSHFDGEAELYQAEVRMRHKDGSWVWVLDTGKVVSRTADGKPLNMTGIHQDITALKSAETKAASNQRKLETLMGNLPGIAFRCRNGRDRPMEFMSRMTLPITGYTPDEIVENGDLSFADLIHPQFREQVWSSIQVALENRVPYEIEYRLLTRSKDSRWVLEKGIGIRNNDGELEAIEGFITDITEQKNTSRVLSLRQQELRETQRIAQLGSWAYDMETQEMHWSEELYNIFGLDPALPAPNFDQCRRLVTDESWHKLLKTIDSLKQSGFSFEHELEIVRASKELGWICAHGDISRDSRGNITGLRGAVQDISKRKHVELDRERFSKRLTQATKMETIGQLTGGIAHDFNNLLAVILGNLELIELAHIDNEHLGEQLKSINRAAQRGADLTKQLLGFSRKQPNKIQLTKVNDLIRSVRVLIARSITPAIELSLVLDDALWPVRMDPGEFQDALLNLTTNALDAMPRGGKLSITTHNTQLDGEFCCTRPGLPPGNYVQISVTDTGSGISAKDLEHIFEPFYTTKAPGKGTGLGLAMVFGFMQRHQGHVEPISEPGEGTTVDLYLPRAKREQTQSQLDWEHETSELTVIGGTETILMVDDEEDLLNATAQFLRNSGYHVFTASDARQALALIKSTPAINLLLSDLVLPGDLTGLDLIEAALLQRPDLKLMVTTGANSNDELGLSKKFGKPVKVLYKPHRFGELARSIRQAFDSLGGGKKTLIRKSRQNDH